MAAGIVLEMHLGLACACTRFGEGNRTAHKRVVCCIRGRSIDNGIGKSSDSSNG